ncbi:hypothetical protein BHM03_00055638, partial [Ensete ventricosum]
MKTILSSQTMDIPEGVTVKVNAKIVEVEGPRGKLTREFQHLNLDFDLIENGKKLKVDAWFGSRKTTAAIRTAISHVQNLITGVTKGYRYKMRLVYAHFPINASIPNNNTSIEIRNFLGEKKVQSCSILPKKREKKWENLEIRCCSPDPDSSLARRIFGVREKKTTQMHGLLAKASRGEEISSVGFWVRRNVSPHGEKERGN